MQNTDYFEPEDFIPALQTEDFVYTDSQADWVLQYVQSLESHIERLEGIAAQQKNEIDMLLASKREALQGQIESYKTRLISYIMTQPQKETKTQYSVPLLHGTLVMKKPTTKVELQDRQAAVQWLSDNDMLDYIKVERDCKWAELKKYAAETGLVLAGIDGVAEVEVPGKLEIK